RGGFGFAGFPDGEGVPLSGVDGGAGEVDVHLLDLPGPAPGGLDHGGGPRVGEQDGGVVIDVGVDPRLDLAPDGLDRVGPLAVHELGGEHGTVAAEVDHRAAAVFFRAGEPVEELGAAADLPRAVVA